jgi:hypothetical protein
MGRRSLSAIAASVLLLAGLALTLVVAPSGSRHGPRPRVASPAPAPLIVGGAGGSGPPRIARAQLRRARRATRRFLAGYLPFLYGRARAGAVRGVTAAVGRTLRRARPRVSPAQRARRPRLAGLALAARDAATVTATATIADGGLAAYPLVFALHRRGRRWLVSELADD